MWLELLLTGDVALIFGLKGVCCDSRAACSASTRSLPGFAGAINRSELVWPVRSAYRCANGCDFDCCQACWDVFAEKQKAEMEEKHNFDMLKQSLMDAIAANKKELAESKKDKAAAEEVKATAEGDLAVDFFFILSGFILTHAHRRELAEGRLRLRRFYAKRLARIDEEAAETERLVQEELARRDAREKAQAAAAAGETPADDVPESEADPVATTPLPEPQS